MLPLTGAAQTPASDAGRGGGERRGAASLPQYPKPENYLPFEVNATMPFTFFVDAKSISVGSDREVRYTLIAKSTDNAVNVSFEGMRCADGEFRVYAYGRSGNSWFEVRDSKWEPVRPDPKNAPRAALYRDYFCPVGGDISTVEEGVRVLKSGGNPHVAISGY